MSFMSDTSHLPPSLCLSPFHCWHSFGLVQISTAELRPSPDTTNQIRTTFVYGLLSATAGELGLLNRMLPSQGQDFSPISKGGLRCGHPHE